VLKSSQLKKGYVAASLYVEVNSVGNPGEMVLPGKNPLQASANNCIWLNSCLVSALASYPVGRVFVPRQSQLLCSVLIER